MIGASSRLVLVAKANPVSLSGTPMLMDCCDGGPNNDIQHVGLLASKAPSTIAGVSARLNRAGVSDGRTCTFELSQCRAISVHAFTGAFEVLSLEDQSVLQRGMGLADALSAIDQFTISA